MKKSIIVACGLALFCTACSTVKDSQTFKDSRRFYYKHINKPAVMDYESVAKVNSLEERLTNSFSRLDAELTKLQRELDSILDLSNQQAIMGLFQQFPWISNIYALDAYGDIQGAIPSYIPDYADFSFINDREVKTREIYAQIQAIPTGHEIVVLRPYMMSGELLGYLAVSFDPKALMPFVGDASDVVLLGVDQILWTGNHLYDETPFNIDWKKALKSRSYDEVENKDYNGAWLVRYYGGIAFIYGIMEKKG